MLIFNTLTSSFIHFIIIVVSKSGVKLTAATIMANSIIVEYNFFIMFLII